ncbi:MAG: ABC transporter ATP-binding protein [Planctomycetes bacterium]|nr:ABC transporter ATP-binding protein [Planctomycetota bacterium]
MSSTRTLPCHPVAVRPVWRGSPESSCEDTPTDDARWQLTARDLHKTYHKGKLSIPVLRGVDFSIRRGGFTAIVGQSGSGKTTLLHLLATLDAPDAGEVNFEGRRIDNLAPFSRDRLRNRSLGMIFQFYHLLPELSTVENVLTPIMISEGVWRYWRSRRVYTKRATQLLDMMGLAHRLHHKPRELSGGEMQRAAIARALIAQPKLLLADEPTGNLDRQTGHEILAILRSLNRDQNLTIVMVTHDAAIAQQADCTVRLVEGRVQSE